MHLQRPGDHVLWKSEGYQRHAIVQSVNAIERTAGILYPDTGTKDIASLLELDPHGTSDPSTFHLSLAGDALGVHRGDYVFIHRPGTTNDLPKPRVPYIGELEAWVRESAIDSEGKLTGWRREMSELGKNIASRRGMDNLEGQIRRLRKGDPSLSWFGEVVEVGFASVRVSRFLISMPPPNSCAWMVQ
jgi:ubiquitin-conjugating enzyme E2 O